MKIIAIHNLGLLAGVSGMALAVPCAAQTAATAPAASASAAVVSPGEIVVTAQRRTEKLRDVPIAITALTPDALAKANITNTTELAKVTPGLSLPLYGAYVMPSIRGISSSGNAAGDAPNVAIYVDGVYQAANSSILGDLPDIQSVQVLKGPQGSLYGQNAAGGAIIIDTVSPSFTWKGKVTLSYGNHDDKFAQGYVAGPLTDTIAISLSGSYHNHDGYADDILRGGHDKGLRSSGFFGKLLWQPTSDISFKLQGYVSKHGDTGPYAAQPYDGNALANLYSYLDFPKTSGKRDFANNVIGDTLTKTHGVSLIGKIGVGDIGTISTVTSYDVVNTNNDADVDGTAVNFGDFNMRIRGHSTIGELDFVSNKFAGFTLTAGAFYLNKLESYDPYHYNGRFNFVGSPAVYPVLPPAAPFARDPHTPDSNPAAYTGSLRKKSYAVYGELSYDITDRLTATIAGRYSWETQAGTNAPLPVDWQLGDPLPAKLPDPRGAFHFSKFTPRAVLRYKLDNNNTFYVSYSQGFKSGYVNIANLRCGDTTKDYSCIDAPVKPEVVEAFEGGYKAHLSRNLDFNLSVFHYNYKDIQVFVYSPIEGSFFQNAATGKITGADLDLTYRPTPELTLTGGASYLHARYGSFPDATVFSPNACPVSTGLPAGSYCGNTQTSANVAGKQLMRTPAWTANGSINWEHETGAGKAGIYVGANYSSGIYFDPNNRIGQKAYTLLDAELSFQPSALKGLRVSVWGKNLTNVTYLASVLESQLVDSVSYAAPRTFGVKLDYQF